MVRFSRDSRDLFSDYNLQKIAAKTKFYKRKGVLSPAEFFDILLYCASIDKHCSLERMSSMAKDYYSINITKQSIDDKFNNESINFVKHILKELLESELSQLFKTDFLKQFNHVRIKDSTKFNIPDKLTKWYKGTGGNNLSNAGICIQYEYDLKSGKILDLEIMPSSINDATNARQSENNIEAGDLVIRDLGYYNLDILSSFQLKGAYFLSKLNTTSKIFEEETGLEISFKKLYKEMKDNEISRIDKKVLVSKGKKMKLRMIIETLPEEVYQKRIRVVNKKNKENGHITSEEYKARARFNIFITNIDEDTIKAGHIAIMYKMRWQIELMFKNWKSFCAINKLKPMKYERFTCNLITRLLLIVLKTQIYWNLANYCYLKRKKILSSYKCFDTMGNLFNNLYLIIKGKRKESEKNIKKIKNKFLKNHWKDKRKGRYNYEEIYELFICKSNKYDYIAKEKGGCTTAPKIINLNVH